MSKGETWTGEVRCGNVPAGVSSRVMVGYATGGREGGRG